MTLAELKHQIDEIASWAESSNQKLTDIHVFIMKYGDERTEDIELKLTLGLRRRVYIDPK